MCRSSILKRGKLTWLWSTHVWVPALQAPVRHDSGMTVPVMREVVIEES